jgi:hypothetical protein
VHHLNPLAVKRFRDQQLHHSVTDPSSARTIAAFVCQVTGRFTESR